MLRRRTNATAAGLVTAFALTLAGCGNASAVAEPEQSPKVQTEPKPKLGLMTSLPLYWPLGAEFADLAGGGGEVPWQRPMLEAQHDLVLLDTLSPIPGLAPDAPETDPLDGLERLAVIQPRGLSPADNVALDDWVRAGGQLLLVLDPMLTGHYDLPLGDPRRPSDVALIPPVVARWGMEVTFDDAQSVEPRALTYKGVSVPIALSGEINAQSEGCSESNPSAIIRCEVGEGAVTVIADAAVFEHRADDAGNDTGNHSGFQSLMAVIFE